MTEKTSVDTQEALYELFDTVVEYGKQVRGRDLDGLESWTKIKGLFSSAPGQCEWEIERKIDGETVSNLSAIYDYVHDVLGMKGGDEDEDHVDKKDWEKYHFYLQLTRIAKKNECSLVRLMQVAYNVGQFQADLEDPAYTEAVKGFYDEHKMGSLHSYVDSSKCSFGTATELWEILQKVNDIMAKNDENKVDALLTNEVETDTETDTDTEADTEADTETESELSSDTDEMTGGADPYYHKYLKYKTKYILLKNNEQ
jgi:hypothetical protein